MNEKKINLILHGLALLISKEGIGDLWMREYNEMFNSTKEPSLPEKTKGALGKSESITKLAKKVVKRGK